MSTFRFNLLLAVLLGITLPLGVIISTHLATKSLEKVQIRDQAISVKGYAERAIKADFATWRAGVTARAATLKDASASLEAGRKQVLDYLAASGFAVDSVKAGQVSMTISYKRDAATKYETSEIDSYALWQSFSVEHSDPHVVERTARGAEKLISAGVELRSDAPEYFFTKLNDLKIEMLGQATRNARERAEQLIVNSGGTLGEVRSANQGVFQITPAYSTEVSSGGMNDTSSIEKSIKAVVTVEYAVS